MWRDGKLINRFYSGISMAYVTPLHRVKATAAGAPCPQAAIAACHAHAYTFEESDWRGFAPLYGLLAARAPSPSVELNRAVAVSMGEGPRQGLAIVDAHAAEPALAGEAPVGRRPEHRGHVDTAAVTRLARRAVEVAAPEELPQFAMTAAAFAVTRHSRSPARRRPPPCGRTPSVGGTTHCSGHAVGVRETADRSVRGGVVG
ncbi:hypothetical protein ACWEWI_36650 [Streptomyces sp. NPDC003753]